MDASRKEYRRIVAQAAMRLILNVDCLEQQCPVAGQLQAGLKHLQDADLLHDREICALILRVSDSPVAQSYRNIRQTNTSDWRWAGLALSYDVRAIVMNELLISNIDHAPVRTCVLEWQQQALRGNFVDDTPWCVIADWFEDLGEVRKATLCRQLDAVCEFTTNQLH